MPNETDHKSNDAPQKVDSYNKADNSERFELRANPSPDAEVLGKFATREEADRAHKEKLDEIAAARAKAVSQGDLPIIADMGVRTPNADAANEGRDAAKSAEQKDLEAHQAEDKKNKQDGSESHALKPQNQPQHDDTSRDHGTNTVAHKNQASHQQGHGKHR